MTNKIEWVDSFDNDPNESGWYAVHYCWDAHEGSFINPLYFDGKKWTDKYPLLSWAGPFQSKGEAEEWGELNDCSF